MKTMIDNAKSKATAPVGITAVVMVLRTCIRSPSRPPWTLRISTGSSPTGPNQCGSRVSVPARDQPPRSIALSP